MATDPMHAITDAEKTIETRKRERLPISLDHRGFLAAEAIADELTRLVAEVKTLRYLFATYAAKR